MRRNLRRVMLLAAVAIVGGALAYVVPTVVPTHASALPICDDPPCGPGGGEDPPPPPLPPTPPAAPRLLNYSFTNISGCEPRMTPTFIIAYQAWGQVQSWIEVDRLSNGNFVLVAVFYDDQNHHVSFRYQSHGVFRIRLWTNTDPYGRIDHLLDERYSRAYC